MMSVRGWLPGGLLFLVATASSWLVFHTHLFHKPSPALSNNHPDAFMVDVSVVRTDATGHVDHRFQARTMWHYTEQHATTCFKPILTIYLHDQAPWYISANYGRSWSGIDKLRIWDHVHCRQAATANNPASSLTTDTINIYPLRKYFETSAPVTAQRAGFIVKSLGAKADLQRDTVELTAHTWSQYVPDTH